MEKKEFIASRMTPEQLAEGDRQIEQWSAGRESMFTEN
jgi:hypothetical protein